MTEEQELIDLCQGAIDRLKERISEPTLECKFYNDFLREYSIKNIEGLTKIPYRDLMSALLYPDLDYVSMAEVSEDVASFINIFEKLSANELDEVRQLFSGFYKAGKFYLLEAIFSNSNTTDVMRSVKKLFGNRKPDVIDANLLKEANAIMDKLIGNNEKPGWSVLKFVEYCKKSNAAMNNIMAIIIMLKRIAEEKLNYNTAEFKNKYKVSEVLRVCSAIDMTKKQIDSEWKTYTTIVTHEINIYKKFKRDIESAFQKDEIINYENIIHDIDDEDVKRKFLLLVYKHNKVVYEEIYALNEVLKRNSLANYVAILKTYNIKKEEVDLSKVSRNSCEDLDKMLKILNGVVGDKNTILRIIEFSDLESVSYFKELKSKGVLGDNAFIKYPSIFDVNSKYRRQLDKNIDIINGYNLSFSYFSKCPDILVENNKLDCNLEILNNYNFIYKLCNTRKMKFLNSDNLIKKLDTIIELGYESFLNDGLDLLNENNRGRIYVLKSMGIKPESKEELLKYLRDDKFFISDDKLSGYIDDSSRYYGGFSIPYDIDFKKILEDYGYTYNSLNFNGVIISKNRVSRNLLSNDFSTNDFLKAIITDCILDIDEIKTIKSCLKNKVYKIVE